MLEFRGIVGMGSMGSAEPINFKRRVLYPSIFKEIQLKFNILILIDFKVSYISSYKKLSNPSVEIPS